MELYYKLFIMSLVPVVATAVLRLSRGIKKIEEISDNKKQIIIGIVFGLCACASTEFGVDIGGATANVRDAAVLCAGLFFGGPAGIIAGFIGGIERYFATLWGAGELTRIACSISTIFAGFYAAFLRKNLFDNKRPNAIFSLFTGAIMEIVHMTMVFVTNIATPDTAYNAVRICTLPMTICNAISVMLSSLVFYAFSHKKANIEKKKHNTISKRTRRNLFILFVIAYVFTTVFVYVIQTQTVYNDVNGLLDVNIQDVKKDIREQGDTYLLAITRAIKEEYDENNDVSLVDLAEKYDVSDIHIIDKNGIIIKSNGEQYIGFDMKSGDQSKEFMCLVDGTASEYVQEYRMMSFYSEEEATGRKYAGITLSDGSFIQVGLNYIKYQSYVTQAIMGISFNRHIGERGYLVVADAKDRIISNVISAYVTLETLGISLNGKSEEKIYTLMINHEKSFLMYQDVEGYKIVLVYPEGEAFSTRDKMVYLNTFMEVLVYVILFIMVYMSNRRLVIDNINKINVDLDSITEGNLDTVVNVRKTDEFSNLSDGVNKTVNSLKALIEKEKTRIDQELQFARNIQKSSLPTVFPNNDRFRLSASMDAQKEVGGDFYDFYKLGRDKLGFIIADVSGKGIPAAMFMMKAKTIIKAHAEEGLPVDEILTQSNDMLADGNEQQMFVTSWMGILDIPTGSVSFTNAGHNPPLVLHNGKYEYLKSKCGFVLAAMGGYKYNKQRLYLENGDKILLYTDGITEAINVNKELYGEDRLLDLLNKNIDKGPDEMIQLVKEDVARFTGEEEQFDDMTMLMVEYTGKNNVLTVKAEEKNLDVINDFVSELLDSYDVSVKLKMKILVSIEEIYINICKHGYTGEKGDATIFTNIYNDVLTIKFIDSGIEFNPLLRQDPDITLSSQERAIGGLGIFMVKKEMDVVSYDYIDNHNVLTIKKELK